MNRVFQTKIDNLKAFFFISWKKVLAVIAIIGLLVIMVTPGIMSLRSNVLNDPETFPW